jgi:NTE family protein
MEWWLMNDFDSAETRDLLHKMPETKIALALGGGAARGWAHIGVLRALDEAKIGVSMVAGTSIGALVGGCYLAGKLDELEEFARSLTMRRIVRLLDLAIGGSGLFGGLRLSKRMREHLAGIQIEDLDRPFTAVATELATGHEIWIHSGSLPTAIHASYALPGIFEPVECNGRTLVDGALVNPVPVSVCRAQEEPLVVAVNLHYDLYGRSAVVKHNASADPAGESDSAPEKDKRKTARLGMTNVMVESYNIIQDRISRARLAGDPPDLLLMPRLSDIGLSEFHRAGESIDRGYEETVSKLEDIRRLQKVLS